MSSVHVAVAVIIQQQKILISLRKPEQHQGGLWEFPGGKVEKGETVLQALNREIFEELDIEVLSAKPFMKVNHDYSDKAVLLDVWQVEQFTGTPSGREGQKVKWCDISQLNQHAFPQANKAIVSALEQIDK